MRRERRWRLSPEVDRGGYFVHSPRFSTFSFSSLVAQGGDAGWARRTPSALAAEAGGGAPPPHLPQPDSGHRAGSSRWTLSRHRAAEDCPASWSGPAFLTPCGPGSGLRGFCAVVLGVTPEGPAQNPPLQPPGLLSPPPHPRINPLPV